MIAKPKTTEVKSTTTEVVAEHLLLHDVSWEAYELLLELFGRRRLRHTYFDGTLEIMSPLRRHEWVKHLLSRIVETLAQYTNTRIRSVGATTLRERPKESGLEPDLCYYLRSADKIKPIQNFDPSRDPFPDLAIEVAVTHEDLNRTKVYAIFGVPEVWNYDVDEDELKILILKETDYEESQRSVAFPRVTLTRLREFIQFGRDAEDDTDLNRAVEKWVASGGE